MSPVSQALSTRLCVSLLAIALLGSRLQAQQADTAAVRLATAATQAWLTIVDEGRYDESWSAAAPAFQQAITKPAWSQALTQARGPFEPFGARTLLAARYLEALPNAPPGPYVVIQYQTKVGGGREVIETVSLVRTGPGTWMVGGYFIKPTQ